MHPDHAPTPIALELLSDTELDHVAGGGITAEDDWEAPVCLTAMDDWEQC
jgi:hypothetical protein